MPFSITTEANELIAIDAQGELSLENIDEGIAKLMQLTEEREDAAILIRLSNMDLGSLYKLASKVARSPEYLELKGRAAKAAVLTDQDFIQRSAATEIAVMPRMDARVFDLANEVDALVWLDEKTPALEDA
jgi:hypothetical protein